MSNTINLPFLQRILLAVEEADVPIPNHKLAQMLDVHPATIRNTLRRARNMLGIRMDVNRKGYVGVSDPGVLDVGKFLTLPLSC